jgi:hypothetical protein
MYWTANDVPLQYTGWDLPFYGSHVPCDNGPGKLAWCKQFFTELQRRARHHPCSVFEKLQHLATQERDCRLHPRGSVLLGELCELAEFIHIKVERKDKTGGMQQAEKDEKATRRKRIMWCRTKTIMHVPAHLLDSLRQTKRGQELHNLQKLLEKKQTAGPNILEQITNKKGGKPITPVVRDKLLLKIEECKLQVAALQHEVLEAETKLVKCAFM